jgi:SAM-dependent methyltransferase
MTTTDMQTRAIYNSSSIVTRYAGKTDLQPAERAIVSLLGPALSTMDLLDVGVGGGRTTWHLAPLVRRYVGVDYAEEMIAACRRTFAHDPSLCFLVADACHLEAFGDAEFDLVFFSFNGIDCISRAHRATALRELMRVTRPGGYLAFSAHNSNYLPEHQNRLRPRLSRSPRRMLKATRRYLTFRLKNGLASYGPHVREAVVFDGAEQFAVPFVYIRPDEQVRQLRELGLRDVRVFRYDGTECEASLLAACADPWLYYLCRTTLQEP